MSLPNDATTQRPLTVSPSFITVSWHSLEQSLYLQYTQDKKFIPTEEIRALHKNNSHSKIFFRHQIINKINLVSNINKVFSNEREKKKKIDGTKINITIYLSIHFITFIFYWTHVLV